LEEIVAAVIVNRGKEIVADRILGAGTEPKHAGWGTGAGTAAEANTDLFTPADEARVSGTSSKVTTTTTNDTYQVIATIVAGAARAITNAGLFDGAGSGTPPSGANLFVKADFAVINLATGDSIEFTFKIKFSN
jgi:hypothetical protein